MLRFRNLLKMQKQDQCRIIRSRKGSKRWPSSKGVSDTRTSSIRGLTGGGGSSKKPEIKPIILVNHFGDFDKTCAHFDIQGGISFQSVFHAAKERLGLQSEETKAEKEEASFRTLLRSLKDICKEARDPSKNPRTGSRRKPESIHQGQISEDRLIEITKLRNKFFRCSRAEDFPLTIELECDINFPENLFLYTSKVEHLKFPEKGKTGSLSHYLIDSTSVLPTLFLDVRHGERVLDAFSKLGDKALLMLQTLYPQQVVCADPHPGYINIINGLMKEYIFDFAQNWENKRVIVHNCDVRDMDTFHCFDKILLDAPSSYGHPGLLFYFPDMIALKEPIYLPELQIGMLENCIRLLRPGGSLIYSTHSITREQNDAVVHIALRNAYFRHKITVTIKDLSHVVQHFTDTQTFKESISQQYGLLILPRVNGFESPLYICKITRDLI